MRSLGWGKAWAAALQSGLACTASGFQGKLAQRQPRVEIPLPDQGGALARLFPIKPWLLVSGKLGVALESLQGLRDLT